MDVERLPSGKFETNELVLELTIIAYNLLRMIGQESLKHKPDQKKRVKRRRIHKSRIRILILISLGLSLLVVYKGRNSVNNFCSIFSSTSPDSDHSAALSLIMPYRMKCLLIISYPSLSRNRSAARDSCHAAPVDKGAIPRSIRRQRRHQGMLPLKSWTISEERVILSYMEPKLRGRRSCPALSPRLGNETEWVLIQYFLQEIYDHGDE